MSRDLKYSLEDFFKKSYQCHVLLFLISVQSLPKEVSLSLRDVLSLRDSGRRLWGSGAVAVSLVFITDLSLDYQSVTDHMLTLGCSSLSRKISKEVRLFATS